MKRQTRRRIFYALIAVFCIGGALLVIRALGYSFDRATGALVETGGIFVKSRTSKLSIFLDSEFIRETSFLSRGAVLSGVVPGAHLIRLEKEGFRSWSRTIVVEPGLVTEFRGILLLASSTPAATTTRQETAQLQATTQGSDSITLDQKGNLTERQGAKRSILAANVAAFEVLGEDIWFVDRNGVLTRLERANGTQTVLGSPGFIVTKGDFHFLRSERGGVTILDDADRAFLVEDSVAVRLIGEGVRDAAFDREGEKLFLQREDRIEILWLEANSHQPFQVAGARETVPPPGGERMKIEEADWYYADSGHLVIRTDEGIFLSELDGRGGRYAASLEVGPADEVRTLVQSPNVVFFRRGKTWFKAEVE